MGKILAALRQMIGATLLTITFLIPFATMLTGFAGLVNLVNRVEQPWRFLMLVPTVPLIMGLSIAVAVPIGRLAIRILGHDPLGPGFSPLDV